MDNLTHSLVGALIGQTGLKRKTALAMPMLVIAANIPDIDAIATLFDGHAHLAIRRGITHGPIAMILLPLLLWVLILGLHQWRMQGHKRSFASMDKTAQQVTVHKGWLLALAYIGCLSHPLFDWLNSYGIRLLMPFSSEWFYGDSIFIIDLWMWLALLAGLWVSRRYERRESKNWRVPAQISLAIVGMYLLTNGLITARAEQLTAKSVEQQFHIVPTLVVANPVPIQFWKREMLWRDGARYGKGVYSIWNAVDLDQSINAHRFHDMQAITRLKKDPAAENFLIWSRMPVLSVTPDRIEISDQRFLNPWVKGRFTVEMTTERAGKEHP